MQVQIYNDNLVIRSMVKKRSLEMEVKWMHLQIPRYARGCAFLAYVYGVRLHSFGTSNKTARCELHIRSVGSLS